MDHGISSRKNITSVRGIRSAPDPPRRGQGGSGRLPARRGGGAVGDIRHMAVHMVGQENAFRRFFLPDQRLERRHMQRGNLRKRFVEHDELRRTAQDQVGFQNTPLTARQGADLRTAQFAEQREPCQQVVPRQPEIAQHPVDGQPARDKTLLREVTHLVGPETVMPYPVDAHRPEIRPQRTAQYLHQAALAAPVTPPVSTARYTPERMRRSPNDNSTESISRICFSEGFIKEGGRQFQ